MRVKICGIRSIDAALAAADAGADLLGFNFAPVSKRRIELGTAREAIAAIDANEAPQAAGIFVNQALDEVVAIAREAPLAYIQLSGDEDAQYCRAVAAQSGVPVIKAVRLAPGHDAANPLRFAGAAEVLLADAAGSYGGSGQIWSWSDAAELAAAYRVLLAGGLTPENVGAAAAAARPWGVDVASGVETHGMTDPEKVRAFIKKVRAYEHSHPVS